MLYTLKLWRMSSEFRVDAIFEIVTTNILIINDICGVSE